MSVISGYILSLCGIAFLGLMSDVILPKRKMAGVIKTAIGVLSIVIFFNLILNFDLSSLNFSFNSQNVEANTNYVEAFNSKKLENLKKDIINSLGENGFKGVNIEFIFDEKGDILEAFVDLKNMVLLTKNTNINKYTNIVEIIKNFVNIRKENIIFNE